MPDDRLDVSADKALVQALDEKRTRIMTPEEREYLRKLREEYADNGNIDAGPGVTVQFNFNKDVRAVVTDVLQSNPKSEDNE